MVYGRHRCPDIVLPSPFFKWETLLIRFGNSSAPRFLFFFDFFGEVDCKVTKNK